MTQDLLMLILGLGHPSFKVLESKLWFSFWAPRPRGWGQLYPIKLPTSLSSEPRFLMCPWDALGFTLYKALPSVDWLPLFFQGQLLLPASPQHHSEMPQGTAGTLPRADFTPLNLVPDISHFIENMENTLRRYHLASEVPKLTKYYCEHCSPDLFSAY